jgi:hypothetical protein
MTSTLNSSVLDPANTISPTVPATVPTKAPTSDVKTSAPVITPAPAIKDVGNTTSVVNQANTDIQTQLAAIKEKALAIQQQVNDKANNPPEKTTPAPASDADTLNNTLEIGNKWVYDTQTGAKTQIPSTQAPAANQTMTDVVNAGAQDTVDLANGSIKKFGDGTYGTYDSNGNYVGAANATNFADAKGSQQAQKDLQSIKDGTYPLNAGQQAQLDQITQQYQKLIEAQMTENANITGNTTGLQNLFGVGGTSIGISAINKTISDGQQKIAALNAEMISKVNAMKSALQSDNIAVLQQLKAGYDKDVTKKQDEIDTIHSAVAATSQKLDQRNMDYALAELKKYSDTADPILPSDTPAQVQEKLKTSPTYLQDQKTKEGQVDQNVLDGMLKLYNKTGTIPAGMGTAAISLKKAFYAAIGGSPGLVDEATTNKAALAASTKALTTQQNQYNATQTSVNTLKSSMARIETYMKPLVDTGSPLLNKPLRSASNALGSQTYSAFENEINTIATEYGKIITGASASISGVSVQSVEDIKVALNDKVTVGQLETVLDAMKQDINARLVSQKGTIDQITSDIHDMGLTSTSSGNTGSTSSGGSSPSGFGWTGN